MVISVWLPISEQISYRGVLTIFYCLIVSELLPMGTCSYLTMKEQIMNLYSAPPVLVRMDNLQETMSDSPTRT